MEPAKTGPFTLASLYIKVLLPGMPRSSSDWLLSFSSQLQCHYLSKIPWPPHLKVATLPSEFQNITYLYTIWHYFTHVY